MPPSMSAAEACEAAQCLWPPTAGPEAAVKLAAAEFLLRQPAHRALTVQVASHVTIALGASVSQLGISKKLQQLLAEDPCFILEKSAKGSVVQCSASQLVSQASWRQEELQAQHQQQQQHQQKYQHQRQQQQQQQHVPGTPQAHPAPAAAHAGSPRLLLRATPRLLQGLEAVWPMQGPDATVETKVKHRAVIQLINAPGHSMRRSVLSSAIKADLGTASIWDLGCKLTLSQLLRQEPGVFVLGPGQLPEDPTISLDAQGALKSFVHQQYHTPPRAQQLQQQQQDAQQVPAAAAGQQQQPRSSALGSSAANGVYGAAAASSSSSSQLKRHAAAQPHASAAAGGGRIAGGVSVSALLQHVSSRVWDDANEQCHLARRALAVRIVKDANPVEEAADQPANTDASAYTLLYAKAGDLINAALKAAYGSSLVPCFNKTPGLFEGHPLFTTLPQQGTVQKRVQLNLPLLLQELAPSAGAGAPAAVRASVLLQCVSSRVWDRSSPQLDMARRTLAYFLVHKANPGLAEDPAAGNLQANPDGEAYTETYAHAGHWINEALKQHFTPLQQQQAYKKLSDVFQGECWVTLPPPAPGGQKRVQLNVAALLQPEAAVAPAVPPGLLPPGSAAAAGSSGSSSAGMGLAKMAAAVPAAAARPGTAGPGSNSSSGKVRAVALPAASLGAGGGDAAATEAALAAMKAAATSLMPPPVSSPVARLAAQPAAYTSAVAVVPDSNGVSSSAPAAPETPAVTTAEPGVAATGVAGSGLSSPAAAAAAAAGSAAAAAAARPDLFHLPPWLAAARAKEEAQQQQLQQQSLSISSSGGPAAALLGSHQQQGAPSLAAADTAADIGAGGAGGAVPLLYELVLSNTVPGWYSASYAPWDSSTADHETATGVAGSSTSSSSSSSSSTSSSSSSPGSSKAAPGTGGKDKAGAGAAAAAASNGDDDDDREKAAGVESDAGAAGVADAEGQAVSGADDDRESADGAAEEDPGGEVVAPAAEPETAAAPSSQPSGPEADSASTAAGAPAVEGGTPQPPAAAAAADCVFDEDVAALLQAVPPRLHPELQPYLCTRSHAQQQQQQRQPPHITHILMDRGHPVTLRLSNRTAVRLDTHLSLGEALQHLAAAQQQDVLASGSSSHHSGGEGEAGSGGTNAAAPHVNGNSTVPKPSAAAAAVGQSGVDVQAAACALFGRDLSRCLGIPRTCHRVCAVPDAAGMLAGLSFCLGPAATAGAAAAARAASLSDVLSGMKASLLSHNFDRPRSLLVLGRPGVSVVGLLREICHLLSSSPEQGGLGLHVMLSDTTGRIAGIAGEPSPAIGSTRCLPVFNTTDRAAQAHLLQRAALHHLPDVLVVGQLGTQEEVEAALQIARSQQLLLVAAAPAGSLQTLLQDSMLCELVGCTHVPNSSSSTGQPLLQRARQAPFAAAAEVLGEDRLCLHPDVQASSDRLMAHLNSSSTGSKQSQGAVGAHAQLRSRGAGGRLLVEFGSGAAAGAALADAAAVAEAMALKDGQV